MAKFRKRPVVIEAIKFAVPVEENMPVWLLEAMRRKDVRFIVPHTEPDYLLIHTLEGTHRADLGDWITPRREGRAVPVQAGHLRDALRAGRS